MLTQEQVERLRACVKAGHGFREVLPSGYPDLAKLVLEYVDRVDSLSESASMACENPCLDCAGCNLAEDTYGGTVQAFEVDPA